MERNGKWGVGGSEQRYLCILQRNLPERKMLETIFILLALIETNGYGDDDKNTNNITWYV